MNYSVFVSCAKGLEYLLAEELKTLGFIVTRVNPQGVYGEANLALVYQLCIWSRLASRIQVILFSGQVYNQQTIYQLCNEYAWQTVFTADKTLAIEFHGASEQIRNSMYGAQLVKDGVVDQCRRVQGARPAIDRDNPQIRLHAYLKEDVLTVSFDVTGYSLHQRGYRKNQGFAPLKENIAAAMLIRAQWPQWVAQGYGLHDPFCGAGTLVIEAAMMAGNIAPGLIRNDQALHDWVQHQPALWEKIRAEALQQVKPIQTLFVGTDSDEKAISSANANAERAGVAQWVNFQVLPLKDCRPSVEKGLLISNPPYGERLGDATQLISLYQQLGHILYTQYQGWQAAILTSNPMLAKATGLRSSKQYTLYNGALECKLYSITVNEDNKLKDIQQGVASAGAHMFMNRLQKNYQHLQKWAKRDHISCYRVYDADLPEYAYAIDIYNDYAVLQEYTAPASIATHKVRSRSLDVMQVVPQVLGIKPENLVIKQRKPQKGSNQYQKVNQLQRTLMVQEGQAQFKVNLYDYLDTGLFLDHRPLRRLFAQLPTGTRFLNCFCYTATASVHAALNGAVTTNVDLSNTYLTWAKDNFKQNHVSLTEHQFIHADCLTWLERARGAFFDVIFLDPPSFSNSKRMDNTLDVQRDHVQLIDAAMHLLAPKGILYFSTNLRHFKLSPTVGEQYQVKDISATTLDIDFKRNQRIHHCFTIQNIQK